MWVERVDPNAPERLGVKSFRQAEDPEFIERAAPPCFGSPAPHFLNCRGHLKFPVFPSLRERPGLA
jgi:hypothetical protein